MRGTAAVTALAALGLAALAGCTSPPPTVTSHTPVSTPSATPTPTPTPTEPAHLSWGPTVSQWEEALARANAMTDDEAIGQVLMVALTTPDAAAAADLVRSRHLGGVILMGGAIPGKSAVTALTSAVQAVGEERGVPVLIGTDEEGGTVSRLNHAIPTLPAFMASGALDDAALTRELWSTHARQMGGLGVTLDFAPDADVTVGLADPTIRARSAGSDPERVAQAVIAASAGLRDGAVIPVIKHFPGHGTATSNSHVSIAYVADPLATLESRDLVPFREAIDAGAPAVMMGHLVVGDWGELPASVNPAAYAYLRGAMGFDGVAFTDALDMEGVTDIYPPGVVEAKALEAGADVLLMPAKPDAAITGIRAALESGELTRERLNDAAAKAILLAQWQSTLVPATGELTSDTAYSAAAAVMAAADCETPLTGSVAIRGGSGAERDRLGAALRDAGVTVVTGAADTSIALLGGDSKGTDADVVVALAGPWALAASHATVYVTAWGRAGPQLDAVARVLTQPGTATGTWPVSLALPVPECG